MKYEDLSFEIEENGIVVKCDILEVIPNKNNSDEPYVIYTDYSLGDNDEFNEKYGKLISNDDNYYIEINLSSDEIKFIEKSRDNEIIHYVNDIISENIE